MSLEKLKWLNSSESLIRKEKCRPATPTTPVYVTLRGPPLDSETGWTGELSSNRVLLILDNSKDSIFFLFFSAKFFFKLKKIVKKKGFFEIF